MFGALEALRWPAYRLFFFGNMLSLVGLWIHRLAVAALGWELTHSLAWLGVISLADLAPVFISGPIGGVLADRFNRLRIIFCCQAVSSLLAFAVMALSMWDLLTIYPLLIMTSLMGAVSGLNQASRLAVPSLLAPPAVVASAVALNAIAFNLARFVGPMIAAPLIVVAEYWTAFAANGVSYLFFMGALAIISLRHYVNVTMVEKRKPAAIVPALCEAARYVAQDRRVRVVFLMVLVSALCARPFTELLAGLVELFHGGGTELFGALMAAVGVGALIGALIAGRNFDATRLFGSVLCAQLLMAISLSIFVAAQDQGAFGIGVAGFVAMLCGTAMTWGGVAAQSLLHQMLPNSLRGRVFAYYGMMVSGGPALGAVLIGLASSYLGASLPLLVGCGLLLTSLSLANRTRMKWMKADGAGQPANQSSPERE